MIFIYRLFNRYARLDSLSFSVQVANYFDAILESFVEYENLFRLGCENDGGYLTANRLDTTDIAISFGIGSNYSWDQDIAKRVNRVLMYDHTIQTPGKLSSNMEFHKLRISGKEKGAKVTNLTEIVSDFPQGQEFLLKMDIEGAEWEVLESISKMELLRMKQIIAEFHDLIAMILERRTDKFLEILNRLRPDFALVNYHPNNHGLTMQLGGFQVSDVVELTFIRRDLMTNDTLLGNGNARINNMPNCLSKADVRSFPANVSKRTY